MENLEELPSPPPPPDYGDPLVQDALRELASTDLLRLCREAKLEPCRATRDLRSCGSPVRHLLLPCAHAALCPECARRCDACPVCGGPLSCAGEVTRLRLYYKCVEARLVPSGGDEVGGVAEENGDGGGYGANSHARRLWALFDVALRNNLVSLICHYVIEVCMDDNAVSSDPVVAFLFDEVVIKDWCKSTVQNLIINLQRIYQGGLETMSANLSQLRIFAVQLAGIARVLDVMVSSITENLIAQVDDMHLLLDNTTKVKQHLEVMIWCIRHEFLEKVESRFLNTLQWSAHVFERKAAADAPDSASIDYFSTTGVHDEPNSAFLFIEEALKNIGIEESCEENMDVVDITSLQDEFSPSRFSSIIDRFSSNRYPFKNLRAAVDVLFLHGAPDMVMAKQSIFLYYLFDRHWRKPDTHWRYLVDDFAVTFEIPKNTVLECLVYYLLDDNSSQALEEACDLIPKISTKVMHPRIAKVLLKRKRPHEALTLARCTGRDGFSTGPDLDRNNLISLDEAVTAVRARIEDGLLTEAFMYQRNYCSRVQLVKQEDSLHSVDRNLFSNRHPVEVLVTEICVACIRRKVVDRLIELPWNSEEEKFLHKSLHDHARQMPMLDHAHQMPSAASGCFLVVFYLQRFRYVEAFQVDQSLQAFELSALETASQGVADNIRLIAQRRQSLVEKGLELLPKVEREAIRAGSFRTGVNSHIRDTESLPISPMDAASYHNIAMDSSAISTVLHNKMSPPTSCNASRTPASNHVIIGRRSDTGTKGLSVLQQILADRTPLRARVGATSPADRNEDSMRTSQVNHNGHEKTEADQSSFLHSDLSMFSTPTKGLIGNPTTSTASRSNLFSSGPSSASLVSRNANQFVKPSESAGALKDGDTKLFPNGNFFGAKHTDATDVTNGRFSSLGKKGSPVAQESASGARWRSDESSEDDEDIKPFSVMTKRTPIAPRRSARLMKR